MIKASLIFLMTYIIISGRRLHFIKIGRPGGVLLGTVLMVLFGVLTPQDVYKVINWDTVFLLLGMMIVVEHLAEAGFFTSIAEFFNRFNPSPRILLAFIVFGTGLLAGFFVNDIVCIFFTPLLIIWIKERKLPPLPFIIALATSTNIGGIITFTGTPQNMIIGSISGINFTRYFLIMFPIGLLCLSINYILLITLFKKEFNSWVKPEIKTGVTPVPRVETGLKRSVFITLLVIIGFFFYGNLPFVALAGGSFLFVISNREESKILNRVDWNLLLFFAGLFTVIGGLKVSGVIDNILYPIKDFIQPTVMGGWLLGIVSIIGSNLFANVPYVLVISESVKDVSNPEFLWLTLAFTTTIAGNLTIIGAIANIIVIDRTKNIREVSFMEFLKFGLPSTILCFIVGQSVLSIYKYSGIIH